MFSSFNSLKSAKYRSIASSIAAMFLLSDGGYSQSLTPEGRWNSDSRQFELIEDETKFIGYLEIKYTTPGGDETGDKIEYYFQFDKEPEASDIGLIYRGELRTFDSYYDCSFNNGEAKFVIAEDGTATIFSPKINFKVRTYSRDRQTRRKQPIYCWTDYGYEYICGWRWGTVHHRQNIRRECVITSTETIATKLTR